MQPGDSKNQKLWDAIALIARIGGLLAGIAGAGLVYQAASSKRDLSRNPPPGNLIDAGGVQMHYYSLGEGGPTVILEALAGGFSPYWAWVQRDLAETARTVSYDRAGFGWSGPDSKPQSLQRTVENLHNLLVQASIPGPFVLVGHSIGGIYMRQFAQDYPSEVKGLVLLDASHPEQSARYPAFEKESQSYLRVAPVLPTLAHLGVMRAYFSAGGEIDFSSLPALQKAQVKSFWSRPGYFESQRREALASAEIFSQAQRLGGLGDLPLMVISRGKGAPPEWAELQEELSALSSNSAHVTVPGATHASLIFNPQHARAVSTAILKVVEAAKAGKRLS